MENGDLELGNLDMIQETVQSLLDCVINEANHTNRFKPSIYMAPSILRDLSPSSFTPKVVSIGPLHKENKNMQAFEIQKINYLNKLMSRIKSPMEEVLKSCVEKVYSSMDKIKACYCWTKTYDDAEVAKMMVMDACFILELFCFWEFDESYSEKLLLFYRVLDDLVLLENQIPFFVLHEIFECTVLKVNHDATISELIHDILECLNLFEADIDTKNVSIDTTDHILSLLHQCYKPHCPVSSGETLLSTIPSAADLDKTWVKFRPNQNPTWLMGMEVKLNKFSRFFGSWSRPTLRMPLLFLDTSTELIFRNLIAYEQSGLIRNHITSYATAMSMLVTTKEDVVKLVDSGVLENFMGSNEEVVNMFNNICNEVTCIEFLYEQEWEILNYHCNEYWPKHVARLRNTYFSSPWNAIALIAGIILFALTVIQTIFTVTSAGSNQ